MLKTYTLIIVLALNVVFAGIISAQTKPTVKKPVPAAKTLTVAPAPDKLRLTPWSIKAGANLSVVYLARNVKDNSNTPGICGGLNYEVNDFIRISTLITHFSPLNIEPTWLNVRANSFEMNFETVARFPNGKTLLYPFAGLSYNTYDGYFTGQSDYLNLKEYYKVNSVIKNRWLGVNFGIGFEHNFGMIGVFLDYRMRVGKQEKGINIMDVCYTGGIKVRLPHIKISKKPLFNTHNRYHVG